MNKDVKEVEVSAVLGKLSLFKKPLRTRLLERRSLQALRSVRSSALRMLYFFMYR